MTRQRRHLGPWLIGGTLALAAAGCSSAPALQAKGPAVAPTPVMQTSHAAATPTHEPPGSLAPAGPAPSGLTKEAGEGDDQPAVTRLADAIGCEDLESQSHLPFVREQGSCRLDTEHVYILTFGSGADRDTYLNVGPHVVQGGYNVIGSDWVVHVENIDTAHTVQSELNGDIAPNQ